MARELPPPYDQLVEDDYIDMDISSTTFLCYAISSPPHSVEFEFKMSANPTQKEPSPSPADELFYKGKLLPLHLPPRLQMVQKLLQNPETEAHEKDSKISFQENMVTPTTTTSTATTTPYDSCNISPANSCHASRELNPEDYTFECSAEVGQYNPRKSWSKKLKSIRQSSLGLKLKASGDYLKSLFTKSRCSDESNRALKSKGSIHNGSMKVGKKNPFGQIQNQIQTENHPMEDHVDTAVTRRIEREKQRLEEDCGHRRSFSCALKWNSKNKSSSTSSSCSSSSSSSSFSSANSSRVCVPQMLRRSGSVNSEVESSIQGAIAYCKMSQQFICTRKSISDVRFASFSESEIASEKPGIWNYSAVAEPTYPCQTLRPLNFISKILETPKGQVIPTNVVGHLQG